MAAVVTDPPYDAMIYYTDTSDLFFAWLRRALHLSHPDLVLTAAPDGLQEKDDDIIVREHKLAENEHRDRAHYDAKISRAFSEARRVVRDEGVVTIVFGHGEPEGWHRLLGAISAAGLVLTGSWPARTEKGGRGLRQIS
jgi:putative DNA methylase